MLTAMGYTPLLVNRESMTSKPNAGGGSKDYFTWKVEETVHNFVRTEKVTTDSSTDYGKNRSRWKAVSFGMWCSPSSNFSACFEHFLGPGNPGREWGRMLVLHIQDAGE